jgi:hypothetical protein
MATFMTGLLGNEYNRRLKPSNVPITGGVQQGPATYDEATKFLWQQPEEDRFRAEMEQPPPSQAPYDDPLKKIGLLDRGLDPSLLKNLEAARKELKLTPEEDNLYQRHLENLWGSGGVDNPDGSRSSLYQAVVPGSNGYHNIPTVWGGKILPIEQALQRAQPLDQFPAYKTPEEADDRYMKMHDYMQKDTGDYFAIRRPQPLTGLLGDR